MELVAESLRFDLLEPRLMPNLWEFSGQALRLEHHYMPSVARIEDAVRRTLSFS